VGAKLKVGPHLELREFAARQGWAIVREYTDEATAKNGERTGSSSVSAFSIVKRMML
jgi:hypothetical protein